MDGTSASWSGGAAYDPMAATTDHDFGAMFDNFDLDFHEFTNATEHDSAQDLKDLTGSLGVQHLQNHFSLSQSPQPHHDGAAQVSQQTQDAIAQTGMSQPGSGFFPFSIPAFGQPSQQQFSAPQEQTFRPSGAVPPTPNSVEMHGDTTHLLEQMAQNGAMFGQYQIRKEDAVCLRALLYRRLSNCQFRWLSPLLTRPQLHPMKPNSNLIPLQPCREHTLVP
jgi:hypothetical protein